MSTRGEYGAPPEGLLMGWFAIKAVVILAVFGVAAHARKARA